MDGCHHYIFGSIDVLQVRESLLLEVRLLRETLREAQGDIERCRYFSAEISRREAEITQRAEAKVQQCVPHLAPALLSREVISSADICG